MKKDGRVESVGVQFALVVVGVVLALGLTACGSAGNEGTGTDFKYGGDGTGELAGPADVPATDKREPPAELPAATDTGIPDVPAVEETADDTASPLPDIAEIAAEVVAEVVADNVEPPIGGCSDCHNPVDTIYSTVFGRNLAKIDWIGGDLHGGSPQNYSDFDKGSLKAPYDENSGTNYVLGCLECHVEHSADDSSNPLLLRSEVNGTVITAPIKANDNSNGAWTQFCGACHLVTVTGPGYPCGAGNHGPGPSWTTRPCFDCHLHMKFICGPGNWSL